MSQVPPPPPPPAPTLHYVVPQQFRRPGLITAVGVISIVLGSLGIVMNLMGLMQSAVMLVIPQLTGPAFTATPTAAVTTSVSVDSSGGDDESTADDATAPRGWPKQAREIAIRALAEIRLLRPQQIARLDDLLAEGGKDAFPFDPQLVSEQLITVNVSDHGALKAGVGRGPGDYFIVGNGRIEVSDDRAAFVASMGSGVSHTVQRSGEEADVVDSQDGSLQPAAGGPATTTAAGTAVPIINPFAGIRPLAVVLVMFDAVLSLGLAVLLLVAGILVLRDSRRGAPLHQLYAWLKPPLAVLGAAATMWMLRGMYSGFATAVPAGGPNPAIWTLIAFAQAAGMALLGCIYPVALLIVLRTRRVREYLNVIREG